MTTTIEERWARGQTYYRVETDSDGKARCYRGGIGPTGQQGSCYNVHEVQDDEDFWEDWRLAEPLGCAESSKRPDSN